MCRIQIISEVIKADDSSIKLDDFCDMCNWSGNNTLRAGSDNGTNASRHLLNKDLLLLVHFLIWIAVSVYSYKLYPTK